MSTEQAKALVERFFSDAWVKGNLDAWEELPEDLVFWSFGTKIEGREDLNLRPPAPHAAG